MNTFCLPGNDRKIQIEKTVRETRKIDKKKTKEMDEHSPTVMNTKRDKEGKIEGKARNKGTTQREVIAKDVVEFHSLLNDS